MPLWCVCSMYELPCCMVGLRQRTCQLLHLSITLAGFSVRVYHATGGRQKASNTQQHNSLVKFVPGSNVPDVEGPDSGHCFNCLQMGVQYLTKPTHAKLISLGMSHLIHFPPVTFCLWHLKHSCLSLTPARVKRAAQYITRLLFS